MLERMCDGPPWQQHMQLQMLKGVYKTEMCNYDTKGKRCDKGDRCCLAHPTDNEYDIAAMVNPFRKIFTELFDREFSLPLEHLHEIGKITDLPVSLLARTYSCGVLFLPHPTPDHSAFISHLMVPICFHSFHKLYYY